MLANFGLIRCNDVLLLQGIFGLAFHHKLIVFLSMPDYLGIDLFDDNLDISLFAIV